MTRLQAQRQFVVAAAVLFLALGFVLSPTLGHAKGKVPAKQNIANKVPKSNELSGLNLTVMTFNVENLFDTTHDAGKNDYTYLPLSKKGSDEHKETCSNMEKRKWQEECLYADWNEDVLKIKIKRLGEVVKTVNNGQGPDILMLQEVENKSVVERWRKEQLDSVGLKHTILIEGKDKRGIDVAAISRYEVIGEPKLHEVPFKDESDKRIEDTRGILELTVKLPNGVPATFLVAHFPAPFHPVGMRKTAYQQLNKILADLPKDRLIVAAGDFNTPSDEEETEGLIKTLVKPNWVVAHEKCAGCKGTIYFPPKESWSFFDMILARFPEKANGWSLEKVWIANENSEQRMADGTPKRFDIEEKSGVSDHWPFVSVFKYQDPAVLKAEAATPKKSQTTAAEPSNIKK